ncbi:MAG: sugar phosphate nucleotidyltransferase [Actinomycetota bacterium]
MKALILAGGFGTRLRPLTLTRPKHLLPIANIPHIELVFDLLQRHEVDEVVLLTSYLAEAFDTTVVRAGRRGLKVEVTHEEAPLGTAGALRNARALIGDDTFLALNGDVLTDVDLGAVVDFHAARGAEATLVLTPVPDPSAFGVVPTEPDGRVLGFIEKPPRDEAPTNLINAGVYVFEPGVLERIPEGLVYSAERELFPEIVADRTMYALACDAYWMDIGTPEKFLQANMDALAGRYRVAGLQAPGADQNFLAEGAQVDASARVSSSCLGRGARIEADATVERTVLLPGALVERGATVRDATLGENVIVAAEAEVRAVAVADGQRIDT